MRDTIQTAKCFAVSMLALVVAVAGCKSAPAPSSPEKASPQPQPSIASLNPIEARLIAKQAYIYGVPMVAVYKTIYAFSVDKDNPQYKGPFNTILNIARVFTPDDTAFVTPNSDTPYSFAGLDLRAEPVVITIPPMEKDRYFVFQLMDLYTFNFAYIGTRTTGNEGGKYLITGPGWKGEVPKDITRTFPSETSFVNVVGRTQLFNPADLAHVKKIQAGYKIQTLHEYLHTPAPPQPPAIDWPKPIAPAEQTSLPFLNQLAFLLQFAVPPHPSEVQLRNEFARIGVLPGKPFDASAFSPQLQTFLKTGLEEGQKAIEAKRASMAGKTDTLFGSRDYLKNDYLARATGTEMGIGANSRDEALYPILDKDSSGQPLDGSANKYTLRFAAGQLPPVNAFWSLTMYKLPEQLLVANPIHRYLINSPMLPHLKTDPDGGLTIYIQADSPGKEKDANWLPAPKGPFMLTLRYYWPKPELLTGQWKSPAIQRVMQQP
ncbi:DUF1254 domain-containing protein [Acidobacterium sp. S8]|uniref:DUF1254 domain-containing protein n=1 Tax=Acidobacterium sp. S8 TaxID=1641854 RepID=UPI001C209CC5|nr:DUF1254 domain-containing protein [Acidobacterium sp. S8]